MTIGRIAGVDAEHPPMPMIVGAARSGTTLLRMMLDAHPELAIPPETGFVLQACRLRGQGEDLRERFIAALVGHHTWRYMGISERALRDRLQCIDPFDVAEGIRAFYRLYAARFGSRRVGDKTPMYRSHLRELEGLLPEASFVHIIRDGRDVALSVRGFSFAPGDDIETIAEDWSTGIRVTREQGRACRRYIEVRFEDLVVDAETELRRICAFLELEFSPRMLRYPETAHERLEEIGLGIGRPEANPVPELAAGPPVPSRAGRWRRDMSDHERGAFERAAGEMLWKLGYETDRIHPEPPSAA